MSQQVEQLKSELQSACEAREQLSQQFAEFRNDLSHARDGERDLRESNEALVAANARREAEFDSRLKEECEERQRLAEEVLALRAKVEASAGTGDHATLAIPSISHEPDTSAPELEAARTEAEELKWKLDDAEYRYRVMAETLAGLGVTVDLKVWSRGNAEVLR